MRVCQPFHEIVPATRPGLRRGDPCSLVRDVAFVRLAQV